VGTIFIIADYRSSSQAQVIYAVSPIAGLALCSGAMAGGGSGALDDFTWVAAASITPTLLFTFVFNALVTTTRRRIRKVVLTAWKRPEGAAARGDRSKDSPFLNEWQDAYEPAPPGSGEVSTSQASS
jgi:hypothetical protein